MIFKNFHKNINWLKVILHSLISLGIPILVIPIMNLRSSSYNPFSGSAGDILFLVFGLPSSFILLILLRLREKKNTPQYNSWELVLPAIINTILFIIILKVRNTA